MTVISLTDCPPSLRGDLTKWLFEINTGVYVGDISARVRDEVWNRIKDYVKTGRATLVYNTNNEQGLDFRVHNTAWEPIDFDGLKLMLCPSKVRLEEKAERGKIPLQSGYSNAAKWEKAKRIQRSRGNKSVIKTYMVVDVETTGLSVSEHEIIEIGALKVNDGKVIDQFYSLVKPVSSVPAAITKLTGLDDGLLMCEGRMLRDVMNEFLEFAEDLPMVSHNADFDHEFICSACVKCELPLFKNRKIDTLSIARKTVRGVANYKLVTLLNYFGIKSEESHHSLSDCKTTKELYEKLIMKQ